MNAPWQARRLLATIILPLLVGAAGCQGTARAATAPEPDASWRSAIEVIGNGRVRVGVDPAHGGRIVEYAAGGKNVLFEDPAHPGWLYPDNNHWLGYAGGRFDIGPEEALPEHPILTTGPWTCVRVDDLHLRLESPPDPASGVQLTRDLVLDRQSSRLRITQTMRNITDRTLRRAYWGRSLVNGGGISVTALTANSRFPNGYIQANGWPDFQFMIKPKDPAVTITGGYLVVRGVPQNKIGLDSHAGWLAYLTPQNQLFYKRFPTFPDRRYADIAGLTMAIWTDKGRMYELEPLGPEEVLAPGGSAAFTEEWWLLDYPFPAADAPFDPARLHSFAAEQTASPRP